MNCKLHALSVGDPRQLGDVVQAQEAAIGHDDHARDSKAFEDRLQHVLERLGLGHIAAMQRIHQRQTIDRLDHAEHERSAHGSIISVVFRRQDRWAARFE